MPLTDRQLFFTLLAAKRRSSVLGLLAEYPPKKNPLAGRIAVKIRLGGSIAILLISVKKLIHFMLGLPCCKVFSSVSQQHGSDVIS